MGEQDARCDADLLEVLATSVDGGFERLVLAYQDRLFGFALRVTGNRRDAEEAAQDALLRAYRALRGYEAERIRAMAIRPWLYRITLNVCRNRLRGARGRDVSLEDASSDPSSSGWVDPPDPSDGPDRLAELGEDRARLAGLLRGLPERYRAGVVLRFVEDLSYAEVAAALGQPIGTAKANVHRGIKLLRAGLGELERAERHTGRNDDV